MHIGSPQKLTDFPWLNLYRRSWENEKGQGEWIYASRKNNPNSIDAVMIVGIHDSQRLVVCKEWRTPLNDYEYSLPAGLKEEKETIEECAIREFHEETGLHLTKIKEISPVLYSSSGLSDENIVMVFADCTGSVSNSKTEIGEEIIVQLLNTEEVVALRNNFSVKQSCKLWPLLYMIEKTGKLC